jgi:hypothetical protein
MAGGLHRHLKSLRSLERDSGWIHHLVKEAENERMHLFFFLAMKQPGLCFKTAVAAVQAIFFTAYFMAYLV